MAEFIAFSPRLGLGCQDFLLLKEIKEKLPLLSSVYCFKLKIRSLMLGIVMSQNRTSGSAEFALKKLRILRTLRFKFYSA